jgi:8-oxo-(d)GTP phosphatase
MANSKPTSSGKAASSEKAESRLIKAAGAVAWRPGADGRPQILLVHRRKYDDWSLPKGKVEPGEALPVTAVREVLEEGGAHLALGRRLNSVRYNVGGRPKRVHYWSAEVTAVDDRAVPNDEVDRVAWVEADRAADELSYKRDHAVVADFARLPHQTVPVILLRHAKAVAKSSWKKGDDRRPLDDAGRADAKALADLLACFGPSPRLITSPAARCVETLRPFAELSGAELREEPSLYIHTPSSRTDPGDSPPSIAALVAEAVAAGEPAIFCAHRENIPVLQAAALSALGLDPADEAAGDRDDDPVLPKEWDDPLPTSGFWVLNVIPTTPVPSVAPAPPDAPTSAGALAPADAPTPADAEPPTSSTPLPAWRRWLRLGPRTRSSGPAAAPGAPVTPPAPLAAPVFVPEDTAAAPEDADPGIAQPPRPASRLVSADRYDLTEL